MTHATLFTGVGCVEYAAHHLGWGLYTELSLAEYEMEVSKQQKHYKALKNEEIRPDWIDEAYHEGVSPIEFLNGL